MEINIRKIVTIIAIIIIFLSTVGIVKWIYFKNNKTLEQKKISAEPINNQDFSIPKQRGDGFIAPTNVVSLGAIAMVIKKENYDALSTEIEQWLEDVKKEGSKNVEILKYDNDTKKEQIKNDLKNLYLTKKLRGVVLVGNVPTAKSGYHCTDYPSALNPCLDYNPNANEGDPFIEQNLQPDDYYYIDINNECERNEKADAFYYDTCQKDSDQYPFWISRIASPIHNDLNESNRLLKEYFDKNHEYRTGKLVFQKKLLIYAPIDGSQGYIKDKKDFNKNSQAFLSEIANNKLSPYLNNTKFLNYEATDEDFFNELKGGHEYVQYNGHGSPVFQQNNITYDLIVKKAPKSFLYEFGSCSVGRFTEEKYLAGAYLFNTEALIVLAAQMPIFVSMQPKSDFHFFLASNMRVGDASKLANIGALEILGDGTLRLQQKEIAKIKPKVLIDQNEMNLEKFVVGKDVDKKYVFKVKNGGEAPLIIKMEVSPLKTYPLNAVSFSLANESGRELIINPGEQKEVSFVINSGGYTIEKGPYFGAYSGFFYILSNDPDNKVVKISYNGEMIK